MPETIRITRDNGGLPRMHRNELPPFVAFQYINQNSQFLNLGTDSDKTKMYGFSLLNGTLSTAEYSRNSPVQMLGHGRVAAQMATFRERITVNEAKVQDILLVAGIKTPDGDKFLPLMFCGMDVFGVGVLCTLSKAGTVYRVPSDVAAQKIGVAQIQVEAVA